MGGRVEGEEVTVHEQGVEVLWQLVLPSACCKSGGDRCVEDIEGLSQHVPTQKLMS
jgi:hypothetical protein